MVLSAIAAAYSNWQPFRKLHMFQPFTAGKSLTSDTLHTNGHCQLLYAAAIADGVIYAGKLALFAKGAVSSVVIRPGTIKICENAFRAKAKIALCRT